MSNIVSNLNDPEISFVNSQYFAYIENHRNNVNEAYIKIRDFLEAERLAFDNSEVLSRDEILKAFFSIAEDVRDHDLSKYSDEEFEPYRIHFYPTNKEKSMDSDIQRMFSLEFDNAWKHHYRNNNHHPKYWVDDEGNKSDMSLAAIIHMLIDWEAVSMAKGGSVIDYWKNHAKDEKEAMTDNTINIVDILINIIFTTPEFQNN